MNFDLSNSSIDVEFYLDNRNDIDEGLFMRIESHFETLHLLERFAENVDDEISTFQSDLEIERGILTIEDIKQLVVQKVEKERVAFGYNYWKSVLKLALINDEDFMSI